MVIGLRRALHFYVVDDPQNNECSAGFVRFEELCTMEKFAWKNVMAPILAELDNKKIDQTE